MLALADRFESVLQQRRVLKAQHNAQLSLAMATRECAQLLRAELRDIRGQIWVRRSACVNAVLRAIGFFEAYGTPKEQMAGLMLADAFFRANGTVGGMVAREPTTEEVRAAVYRVIASEALRGSPLLIAFLQFVVEATLRGEVHQIKPYTIAIEALGREDHFDPQTDPIVLVMAGRLRRALKRYYAKAGAADSLLIHIPQDHYVPQVQRRQIEIFKPG